VGTFTWRGKTTPIAIRVHQDGLLLQRLYFANEVYNATEIDQGADPKIRDQERTLAELSETEFQPEKYEDEYRQRLLDRGQCCGLWSNMGPRRASGTRDQLRYATNPDPKIVGA
jgi:hypothetical protein